MSIIPSGARTQAETNFRTSIDGILNSIDRIKAGDWSPEVSNQWEWENFPFRLSVLPSRQEQDKWDLYLVASPPETPDWKVTRIAPYWLKCDDRRFLQALADVGNAYIKIV